jgi:hypothetical protein
LNWIDKSTNEKGFRIQRKTGNGNFALLDSVGLDITTYTDKNILIGQSYTYRVVSFNTAGISITYSNEVTIATISLPVLQTIAISDTTGVSATSGGQITSDGGSPITARGVVWGTSSNPEITLATKTSDGTGTGVFSSKLSALKTNTKYYVRAFATNLAGTAYGQELSFTTFAGDIQTGLIAFYPFSGNAIDSSGNGNNGTVYGATLTTDRFGNANSAYSFTYSGWNPGSRLNEIYIPYNPSFNSQTVTVSAWAYPRTTGWPGSSSMIITRFQYGYSNPNGQTWQLFLDSNKNVPSAQTIAAASDDNQAYYIINGNTIPINQWSLLTYTFNGNIISLYINGNLVSKKVISNFSLNTNGTSGISIGVSDQANGFWNPFEGNVDDIRIYNRALDSTEVQALYHEGGYATLPVKLINIEATNSNGIVAISWQTSTETNTANFIIQHSTDGNSFTSIGTVKATGSGANRYSFTDTHPTNGTNYYRLQSVDKDGASTFSKVVSCEWLVVSKQFTVVPNPARDIVTVKGNHIAFVQVVDNIGRVLKTVSFKDATNPTLSVGGLPKGVYHLRVETIDGNVSGSSLMVND